MADSGDCLYASDPDAEVEFVTRARARYWDFKPFLDEQWRIAGQRLEERSGHRCLSGDTHPAPVSSFVH